MLLIVASFVSSCSDLKKDSATEQLIDAAIAARISVITDNKLLARTHPNYDLGKTHSQIKQMYNSIVISNACTDRIPGMDNYFRNLADSFGMGKNAFIELTPLELKDNIKFAIKLNELTFLDNLIPRTDTSSKDPAFKVFLSRNR